MNFTFKILVVGSFV